MVRTAVCDDDLQELRKIHEAVLNYSRLRMEKDISVKCFSSSAELAACLEQGERFDLYLLDVLMPQVGGIELGRVIRRKDRLALIVYLTTSRDYALQSYSVKAFDYMLKPLEDGKLERVLDSALEKIERELDRRLVIKTADGTEAVSNSYIQYIECDGHNMVCHTADGRVLESLTMRKSFKESIAPLLQDERFLRISVSYVINMNYVRSVNTRGFVMHDGAELPVTRSYKNARQDYIDFILERGRQV